MSAEVDFGASLREQLTRLNVVHNVKDWNSIARFLQKADVLDKCDKSAQHGNDRHVSDAAKPFPLPAI